MNAAGSKPLPLPDRDGVPPADSARRGFFQIAWLGPRAWKRWWIALVRGIDHQAILAQVAQDAAFSFHFNFMLVIAGGIATIGLLLNSPAVIIGAMLISPLMGPIVAGGIALATLDVDLGRQAARTLALGIAAAVAFTAAIVLLSPVRELTPELLARTRPNLFDLVVAVLSGAAGGYALIRGRGGAIVGVAIATALMPPLATVGYGIATAQWAVARGALLLFVTNMAAIGLSVWLVAEWYGFGQGGLRKRFARQAAISLLILAPLGVPLFFSLQHIAFESFAQSRIRGTLEAAAARLPEGQLGEVEVKFLRDAPVVVRALLFSAAPQPALNKDLQAELAGQLGQPVELHLTQLRAAGEVPPQLLLARAAAPAAPDIATSLRAGFPAPLAALDVDPQAKSVRLLPRPREGISLAGWQAMERELAARHADWKLTLIPPPQALPMVRFARGQSALDDDARAEAQAIAWALRRWGIARVEVAGHASSEGGGSAALARARAKTLAGALALEGIDADARTRYPLPAQRATEREYGQHSFRAASVQLPAAAPSAIPSARKPVTP